MVLDLTNSDKYYDPQEFTTRNVRYVKVGHSCCRDGGHMLAAAGGTPGAKRGASVWRAADCTV